MKAPKRSCALVGLLLVSCAPAAAPPTASRGSTPAAPREIVRPAAPPQTSYVEVFDTLVKRIESTHQFPPAFVKVVGHPWSEDVPALREEMLRAKTREDAILALGHLQKSLRDPHCWFDPPHDVRERRYSVGLSFWSGGTVASPDVRVDEVLSSALESRVRAGDRVVAVDGVPVARWFAENRFETDVLEPLAVVREIASRIFVVGTPFTRAKKGTERKLRLSRDGAEIDVALAFEDANTFRRSGQRFDRPPPMADVACDGGTSSPEYGDYTLTSTGVNVCIYTTKASAKPRVPIVRWVSFSYEGRNAAALRAVKVDHDLLKRELAGAAGVILDLRENNGGSNPFLFLSWFAKKPLSHPRLRERVVAGIDEDQFDSVFFSDSRRIDAYQAALAAGKPFVESRFLCDEGECDDVAPKASERVTDAPVALLTGSRCVSSCDTFALTWKTYGLGLIAGEQPNHAYTVTRLPFPVTGPNNEPLGTFRVALSASYMPGSESPIEGEPFALDWVAPHTFETRSTWTKLAVDELRRRLTNARR